MPVAGCRVKNRSCEMYWIENYNGVGVDEEQGLGLAGCRASVLDECSAQHSSKQV